MNIDRIKEIQKETSYPKSVSVQQALLKVWNECEQEQEQGDERKCETCIRHTSNPRINGLPQCYAHGIDANLCVQYIPIPQRPTCPDAIINPTKLRQMLLAIFHHNMGDFKIEHYAKLIEDSFVPTEQPTNELSEEDKIEVFSRDECIFKYCPHPELCKDECQSKASTLNDKINKDNKVIDKMTDVGKFMGKSYGNHTSHKSKK